MRLERGVEQHPVGLVLDEARRERLPERRALHADHADGADGVEALADRDREPTRTEIAHETEETLPHGMRSRSSTDPPRSTGAWR
jgi:hypothetical protein